MKQTKLSPSALFLMTFGLGLSLSWIYPWHLTLYMYGPVVRWAGVMILMVSLILNILAYREFKKSVTPHAPFSKPKVLIIKSVFSLSRNPVYLALIFSQLGLAFMFDSIWILITAGMLWIVLDRIIVIAEEEVLEKHFKHEYVKYKNVTRRWL